MTRDVLADELIVGHTDGGASAQKSGPAVLGRHAGPVPGAPIIRRSSAGVKLHRIATSGRRPSQSQEADCGHGVRYRETPKCYHATAADAAERR
jgi:hypothetical protein